MPSHSLHKSIYLKLMHEVEGFIVWTRGLLDKVDKILDDLGEHDVGRKPDPESFGRMLFKLWLEFGDVYDTYTGRRLELKTIGERELWYYEVGRYERSERYLLYIPDDVLALATLHHILDLCMDYLRTNRIDESESYLMIDYAKNVLIHYRENLSELKTAVGVSFDKVFDWLIGILKDRSRQLYRLLINEIKMKGLEPGLANSNAVMKLLQSYVRKIGYSGIIYVNDRPLPIAAAAKKIFKLLTRGETIELGFTIRDRYLYYVIVKVVKVSNIRELREKLEM